MAGADPPHRAAAVSSVVELTRALVAIDSVSSSLVAGAAGEAEIAAFVAARLRDAGFQVDIVDAADPLRPSVVATLEGSRPGRTVVLNGHLDTVGVEGMTEPFVANIDGDRMRGRGTSDMKGGVAGLLIAAEQLAAGYFASAGASGRLVVALVADEEDGSLGATAVLDHLRERDVTADVCLIAEPTWLDLAVAHRGYEVVRVGIVGRAAHSSQPAEGADVIPVLGGLLIALSRRNAELRARAPHPLLSHGSLMATVAKAGTAPFTVAAEAEVVIERRTLPGESGTVGVDEVRALIAGLEAPGIRWSIDQMISRSAWQADDSTAAGEFITMLDSALQMTGAAPASRTGAPYWMESALWQEAGIPTVVCGPAGGGLHAVDEWVELVQLERFPIAVADAVARFLSS